MGNTQTGGGGTDRGITSEEIRLRDSQSTPVSHTPGPWEVGDNGVCTDLMVYCNDALGSRVANCSDSGHGITNEQDKANARLIAAAPELLEALQAAQRRLELIDDNCQPAVAVRLLIGSALAKAVTP